MKYFLTLLVYDENSGEIMEDKAIESTSYCIAISLS